MIVGVGLTYTAPMGFYSKKIKPLNDLPQGASVGIQNDPSNGNRALLLLQLPRSLDDLSAASINTDYAVKAGLSPTKDAIATEDLKGPYANLIAVRDQDRNKPWVKKLVAANESQDVKDFINTQFKGSIIPAF